MKLHHGKHHAAYVAGLNGAVDKLPSEAKNGDAAALASIQAKALSYGTAVRNHGGGHYNHALFWVNMAPASTSSEPSPDLAVAIDDKFGSLEGLRKAFTEKAMTRFGSGWAWLGVKADGTLAVTSTANQDNPIMEGLEYDYEKMIPILGLDVWEHAYYLKYQNRRADYISSWWTQLVNWKKVSRNYEMYAKKGQVVPPTPTGSGHAMEL
eukprot:CAMPEP_0197654148 /NCGR_PEP_ID=MMETSP1338-20131121/38677_1 /TAXON_ID=43686 ORGANISM="Pelagodinium beii, Strain RCC1491" /NCGR_SAMPLE_ID=MMETSP1338 /ASSEMBLY_ACC=CAM_ASM_000754 /LENGTH=208 /DNA_ID=CAMNT_0043229539 /DNA_START=221 /DNA_END=847 /DNA_ORIENTATION=+